MEELLFRRCELDHTSYNRFKYPKEGWVEAEDYDTKEECGGGLHALRVGDDLGFLDPSVRRKGLWQVFTDYEGLIGLYNKVKIRKGFVRTGIDITEYRNEFLKNPRWAWWYARYVDECSSDDTRKAACRDPVWVYRYALDVDKCARDDTRKAVCGNPKWAYMYALNIDKCARSDTRQATNRNSRWKERYQRWEESLSKK